MRKIRFGFWMYIALCVLSIVIASGAYSAGPRGHVDAFVWSAAGLLCWLMAMVEAKGETDLLARGFDRYFVEVRRENEGGEIKTEMRLTYAKSAADALAEVFRPGDVPIRCGKLDGLGVRAAAWAEIKNMFA